MRSTLYVCVTCRDTASPIVADKPRPGRLLLSAVERELANDGVAPEIALDLVPVECLSNCRGSCTVAVTAPGKWTYVIGGLDPDRHATDIVTFARQHQAHETGLPVWRERPEHIRKNVVARVPPTPSKELS